MLRPVGTQAWNGKTGRDTSLIRQKLFRHNLVMAKPVETQACYGTVLPWAAQVL